MEEKTESMQIAEVGHGRHKGVPNDEVLTPYQLCAGLIIYGWLRTRGTMPAHTSKRVWEACEMLWLATELPRSHWGSSLSGWQPHLRTIKERLCAETPDKSIRHFWEPLMLMYGGVHINDPSGTI